MWKTLRAAILRPAQEPAQEPKARAVTTAVAKVAAEPILMTTTLARIRKEVSYDEERNFEVVAANSSVDYLSCTHRAWDNQLCEHVGKEGASLARLPFFM